jgi:hypothetical protein
MPLGSDRVQLGPCRSLFQHLPYELALRQSFLRHTCLRIQIECDSTVRMTKKFLHDLHILAVLCEQRRVRMTPMSLET